MSDETPPQPEPSEATFGEELRKQREIRGISLAEIADATKISKRFLAAIEKNDFHTLPAPVFTRGFVREYARYLGLNAEEMVDRYAHFMKMAQAEGDQPLPLSSSALPDRRPSRDSGGKFFVMAGVVVALLIAAIAVVMWQSGVFQNKQQTATAEPVPTPASMTPVPAATPTPPPADETLTLLIETDGAVWMVADSDGARVVREQLPAGVRRTIFARDSIVLREVGNAGALRLTFNGTPLPVLGETGKVIRDIRLDRELLRAERTRSGQATRTP